MKIDEITIPIESTVREAIEKLDQTKRKAVFIVDSNKQLLGLFYRRGYEKIRSFKWKFIFKYCSCDE